MTNRAQIFAENFRARLQKFLDCNLNIALLMNRVPRLASDDVNNCAVTSE
jgi:hypothetical protein